VVRSNASSSPIAQSLRVRLRPSFEAARPWLPVGALALGAVVWALRAATAPAEYRASATPAQPEAARASLTPAAAHAGEALNPARALALSSDDARALCLAAVPADSGVRSLLLGNMAKARAFSDRPDAWVDVGMAWMRQLRATRDPGYALNADACARVALEIAPDQRRALGLSAQVRLDAHEFARAREIAEAVLAREPEDAGALGTLSDAALELGDVSTASAAAQRLLDVAPGLGAYARASYLRWLHGDEPGALEMARLAIDAAGDPDEVDARAWVLVQTAHLFWHRGDVEGAAAGYRMALDVRAGYAPALLGLGKVAIAEQRYRDAAEQLSRALAGHADVETAALLGEVLQQLNDPAGAARNEAQVEQLGRHDRRAHALFLAGHRVDAARAERAVLLARAEREVRGDVYTEDALGWALYAAGQLEEAEQHAERATRLGTRDALLDYHLGAIRVARGKLAEGKAALDRALRQNPHFDRAGAADARRLLVGETRSPRRVFPDVEEGPSAECPIGPGSTRPSPAQRGCGEPGTNLGHEVLERAGS
jgi:tetratricopeptide (TPR) repeat protein